MENEVKKVSPNDAIVMMVNSINSDRIDAFYKAVESYVDGLSTNGDIRFRLKRLLNEKPMKLMRLDSLSNDVKNLILQTPVVDENVFLSNEVKFLLDELTLEWDNKEVFNYHNLPVRNKILFHGPTGNGKTTTAKYVAKLINKPFVEVKSDMVIDSHLGSTGGNINKIFNNIKEPCVLFWDEIDSIGRKRGVSADSAASIENDRMVNSILVNIEKLNNDVIFIGATNRKSVLDTAFMRRFDVMIELKTPSIQDKQRFAKQILNYYNLPDELMVQKIEMFDNFSEIKQAFTDIARKYALDKIKAVA